MNEVQRSITSSTVIQCLAYLFDLYGAPTGIKSDNGPEFVARRVQDWLKQKYVDVHYIDPGSPWQNGTNESFNAAIPRWLSGLLGILFCRRGTSCY